MESVICLGISGEDRVINTINTGRPRTLSDALFRSVYFADMDRRHRVVVSKACSFALKLIWHRTQEKTNAFVPKRSHQDYINYLDFHPRIIECVSHIWEERVSLLPLCKLGYAAGMMYLMSCSATDPEKYQGTEESLDFKLWDDANDFWVRLSNGVKELAPLHKSLTGVQDLSGSFYRDEVCALISKGWVSYTNKKPITAKTLRLKHKTDTLGRSVLVESPTVGGIDLGGVEES
jgi:hypothetical protein